MDHEERDWRQALAKDLDNDDHYHGRAHIQALLEKRVRGDQHAELIGVSRAFFMVFTHPELMHCLSVDTYVGSLYNFISGANGNRAVPFLKHVCEAIASARIDGLRTLSLNILDSTLVGLSNMLSELLRRETRFRYNEDLPGLVSSLEAIVEIMIEEESRPTSEEVKSRAGYFRAAIARAGTMLSTRADAEQADGHTSELRSAYPRDSIVPSERHDNDKKDIPQISIFPTRGELLSDAPKFLPSTDPDQPHFLHGKIERYIDTNFRLLRHDVFGQLQEDFGSFLAYLVADPDRLTKPLTSLGETRVHSYLNAFVMYLALDRYGELQADMAFLQPTSVLKRKTAERRRWWEESKRLSEGVLLALVWIEDGTVQYLFVTVSKRRTDTGDQSSLASHESRATVTIRLTTQDQQAVRALLRLSCDKIRGILLEFPNVLPGTFVPVLKSLQDMQRHSRLPFSDWILPGRMDDLLGAKLDVPPPAYARSPKFNFPMTDILKQGAESLSVFSSSSQDDILLISDLEERTGLDQGQCVALVAALTHEFAFIQGPPGTGKSFLGVKLMQVLLHVKKEAGLGPIIVV